MRRLFRWAFRLFILTIVLIVAGILLLNTIARQIAEYRLSERTGLEVKIGRMDIGLLNPRVTVENLVIYNSPEFGGSPMLDLPELHLEYDAGALWSHKLHCRLVRVNFARGSVVEDTKGRLNLEVLRTRLQKPGGGGGPAPATTNKPANDYKFLGIDTLNLTLGRVDFFSMKNPSHVDSLRIDIHNVVKTNVQTAADFGAIYDGSFSWVLLHNGINPADTNNPNNPWPYWEKRLQALGKK